jgi:SAM-dependent methyltransferase
MVSGPPDKGLTGSGSAASGAARNGAARNGAASGRVPASRVHGSGAAGPALTAGNVAAGGNVAAPGAGTHGAGTHGTGTHGTGTHGTGTHGTSVAGAVGAAEVGAAGARAAGARAGGTAGAAGHALSFGLLRAGRHRAADAAVRGSRLEASRFTLLAGEYAAARPGQPVALLQAGCATAVDGIDLALLRETGCELSADLVDTADQVVAAAMAAQSRLASSSILGDLRTVPLPPRSYDIVHCSGLLERIPHAELVLDRIVAALKPGGLLLLRTADRGCAAGFIDRAAPQWLRRLGWRGRHPGKPGPYPAIYEELVSARGIASYVLRRGLVIAERGSVSGPAAGRPPPGPLAARTLLARLSGGRLTADHDELTYVIRRPEDLFARVL